MIAAVNALIAEMEAEAPVTRRVLERLPEESYAWRPHARSMSLGQLGLHVATIPGRLTQLALGDGFDVSNANSQPPQAESRAALLATFDESIANALRGLSTLDEASANAPWSMTHGSRVVFTLPRLGVVRTLAFNHQYHHRGQLLVYLRLLDIPVPRVYGRSADDNPFAA